MGQPSQPLRRYLIAFTPTGIQRVDGIRMHAMAQDFHGGVVRMIAPNAWIVDAPEGPAGMVSRVMAAISPHQTGEGVTLATGDVAVVEMASDGSWSWPELESPGGSDSPDESKEL